MRSRRASLVGFSLLCVVLVGVLSGCSSSTHTAAAKPVTTPSAKLAASVDASTSVGQLRVALGDPAPASEHPAFTRKQATAMVQSALPTLGPLWGTPYISLREVRGVYPDSADSPHLSLVWVAVLPGGVNVPFGPDTCFGKGGAALTACELGAQQGHARLMAEPTVTVIYIDAKTGQQRFTMVATSPEMKQAFAAVTK